MPNDENKARMHLNASNKLSLALVSSGDVRTALWPDLLIAALKTVMLERVPVVPDKAFDLSFGAVGSEGAELASWMKGFAIS